MLKARSAEWGAMPSMRGRLGLYWRSLAVLATSPRALAATLSGAAAVALAVDLWLVRGVVPFVGAGLGAMPMWLFLVGGVVITWAGPAAAWGLNTLANGLAVAGLARRFDPDRQDARPVWAVNPVGLVAVGLLSSLQRLAGGGYRARRALGRLLGEDWRAGAYLVVPVVVEEEPDGLRAAFDRSRELVRGAWPEDADHPSTGLGMLAAVAYLGFVAAVVVVGLGLFHDGPPLLAAVFGGTGAWRATLWLLVGGLAVAEAPLVVCKAALYHYARHGEAPRGFDGVDFDRVV